MPVVFAGAPDIARAMGGGGNHGAIVVAESFWADLKGLHSKDLQYELAYQVLADSLYAGARPQWIVEHEWSAAFLVAQAVARDRDFEEVRRLHFWLAPR